MDYKELAKKFIEDGAWDGVPAIAVRLFAQWLEEHEAAEQSVHPTLLQLRDLNLFCPLCGGQFDIELPASQSG